MNSLNGAGTSSDFTFKIPDWDQNNRYDRIVLAKASIPKSYYNVDSTCNSFSITEVVARTCTIPVGVYSFSSLQSALQTSLNTASPYTYAVSRSTLTGLYTITVSGNSGVQPVVNLLTARLANLLGFSSLSNTFAANTLTSTKLVDLQSSDNILILSDRSGNSGNVLANIFASQQDFTTIHYVAQDFLFLSQPLANPSSDLIRITLCDFAENTRVPLLLNDAVSTFVIGFYKSDDLTEKKLKLDLIDHLSA